MQNYPSCKELIFTKETEEKLRQTVALVTEREDQIHQLQGELQDTEKVLTLNFFFASGNFYRLLINFANSLDPGQNVCPDLDPNCLTL